MRTLAVVFSAFGLYGLLKLINVEVYHFMPVGGYGSERGLIEAALGLVFGGGSALIALLFAFLHFRRARSARVSRLLLAWCCFLTLGFVIVFVYALLDSRHTQAA